MQAEPTSLAVRALNLLRTELWAIAALAVVAGGVLLFLRLADLVVDGETEAFDRTVLLAFRAAGNPAEGIGPPWLPGIVRDITALGGFAALSLITIFTAVYLIMAGKRGLATLVIVAVVGGTALSQALKWLFDRARPDLVPGVVLPADASFPSGHAMLSAITYLTLGALLTRVERRRSTRAFFLGVAVTMTVLVGLSRIYLGVHWPTDVLAGWCLGGAWALLCWTVALWLQRRGAVETAGENNGARP